MAEHNQMMRPIARNLKAPARPKFTENSQSKIAATFKANVMVLQSMKKVKISHFENGPFCFYVHTESLNNEFQELVGKLQKVDLRRLTSHITQIGVACLARFDHKIYRAAIAKIPTHDQNYFVNFVDYGFSGSVPAANLFYIPDEFLNHYTFAMPFCLTGMRAKDLKVNEKEINFYFRQLTEKQSLNLKCVSSDGPPICQHCELYFDDKTNVLDKLKLWDPYSTTVQFRPHSKLEMKVALDVKVSYVDSAQEFYIHIQQDDILNYYDSTMDELYKAAIHSPVHRHPKQGSCCAVLLSGEFYRGLVVGLQKNQVQVKLVDFGIVESIPEKHVQILTDKFSDIAPFAYRACLKGFENMEVSENISTQFDIFCGDGRGERKIFKMVIYDIYKDSYLVELEDSSVNPPVNVNKMLLKNSRPLIETIQLENAKKRQKESRRDGNSQKSESFEPVQQQTSKNYDRDRNNAQRGRGNHMNKGVQRSSISPMTHPSDATKQQQNSRTYFGKPSRPEESSGLKPQQESTAWRSKESTPSDHIKDSDPQKSKNAKQKANGSEAKKSSDLKSGWVSTLLSINKAFVHYDEHIEGLERILDEMFAFYENKNSRPHMKDLQVGSECASRSSDGNWYRSKIESVTGDKVKVFHREYGNSETVHKSKLRKLDEKFADAGDLVVPAYFAIKASTESDEKSLLNELMKIFEDGAKEFNFKVVQKFNKGWILDPIEQQTHKNVFDELVKAKKAQRISQSELQQALEVKIPEVKVKQEEKPKEVEKPMEKPKELEKQPPKKERKSPDKIKKPEIVKQVEVPVPKVTENPKPPVCHANRIAVKITAVTSPTDFYISRADSAASFNKLHGDIQIIANNLAPLHDYEEGTLCLAQQPYDQSWYRAKIIDSDEADQMITVRSLDDGKTFSVDDKKLLKMMPAALEQKKFFGIACSLPIKVERRHEEDAASLMMKLMEDELQVEFLSDCRSFVELFHGDENVTDILVQKHLARRLETVEAGKCYTSHINSTQSFFLQFEMDQLKLDVISQYFEEAGGEFEKVDPKPGDIIAALYPDDNCWYRSKVESIEDKGLLVRFIDYGNVCLVENIGKIAEPTIKDLPPYAKHCSLRLPKGFKEFSEAAEQKFADICANGATILDVKMAKPGEAAIVDVFIEGQNIVDDLIGLCDPSGDASDATNEL